jgi:peptidoglycan-N-acetylmuramic acid deacetylase
MNHHRLGVTALILLIFLTIIYAHRQLSPFDEPISPIISIPFAGKVPEPITRGDTSKKQVIFTFDGGEGSQSASIILDVLQKHHTHGTFFLTGLWVTRNPDLVKRMQKEGHEIYNHTLTHPHLPTLDREHVVAELVGMDRIFSSLTSSSTKPYFRPPYGEYDRAVLASASRAGYRAVMWTVDAGDWMESQGFTEEETRQRIFSHLEPGAIILMHLGDTITGSILDDVFTKIEEQGYSLVPLSQGLNRFGTPLSSLIY